MSASDVIAIPVAAFEASAQPVNKAERERRTFQRLLPQLLTTHRGKYVAIHDEQVVDSGDNDVELILRVRSRVGNVALYVGLVTDEPPLYRIPHYRVHRTEATS